MILPKDIIPILHTVALEQHTSEMQFSRVNLAFQP